MLKYCLIFLTATLPFCAAFCQKAPIEYTILAQKADSFFYKNDYKNAHLFYSKAFASNGDMGFVKDRYNAACAWNLDNNKDSAFFQLYRIAERGNFAAVSVIMSDEDLMNLHTDPRWNPLIDRIKINFNAQKMKAGD